MAPIIHRTAARKRKRITNTSIRLLHPTILTTIPRNTTFTISSALRLGSFPRRPHCITNLAIVFLAQRFFSSRLGNQLFDGGVTRREDGIEDQTSVFGDLITMRVGKFLNQPVGAQ